jgi:glycosyltransferase involved in cell wall biosynthesis
MKKTDVRKKIGLWYFYDEEWVGGAYYIQNLVIAFNTLEDPLKPYIVLFSDPELFPAFKKITDYPYLMHSSEYDPPLAFYERAINKLTSIILKKRFIKKRKFEIDLQFPVYSQGVNPNGKPEYLHWIPDFQEHYLPEFFSKDEIERRATIQKTIAMQPGSKLLLSSQSAYKDYKNIYPNALTKNFIVPFAVSHPPYQQVDIEAVKRKHHVPSKYFISANQFWAHKNHRVIIQAIKILKDEGTEVCVVFTGKQNDWRNPAYFGELEAMVKQNNLDSNILFLGLIDRLEQLQLLKHAEAVIQSSKFEGWSTVIEDSKAMDQFVISSNIPVHLEQLKNNAIFFHPEDAFELANIIKSVNENRPAIIPNEYTENVKKYALDFLNILEN